MPPSATMDSDMQDWSDGEHDYYAEARQLMHPQLATSTTASSPVNSSYTGGSISQQDYPMCTSNPEEFAQYYSNPQAPPYVSQSASPFQLGNDMHGSGTSNEATLATDLASSGGTPDSTRVISPEDQSMDRVAHNATFLPQNHHHRNWSIQNHADTLSPAQVNRIATMQNSQSVANYLASLPSSITRPVAKRPRSGGNMVSRDGGDSVGDGDEGLFVNEPLPTTPLQPRAARASCPPTIRRNQLRGSPPLQPASPRQRRRKIVYDDNDGKRRRSKTLPSAGPSYGEYVPVQGSPLVETSLGVGLGPSRYSGVQDLIWHVNKVPEEPTRAEKVTEASLVKRGLQKGQEETVLKRGYGANDSENIEIVNLKDTTDMSFTQIADFLNKKRVNEGRDPSLTMTAVNGRYNRTAPIIYQSQGKVFVPLAKRKKSNPQARLHGSPRNPNNLDGASWGPELDLKLVEIVREYEKQKWDRVKEEFENATGYHVEDKGQLAKRFSAL